ncbi:hypothetical protein [Runella sp.]|uniref:hypothetical protein n=1 Tax=Runella sp. TaxID=1960881 RepID=UPI003D0B8CCA
MEDIEMINLWKSYDKKLEESLNLNRKNAEDITKMKVSSLLGSMKPLKIFTLLTGILWVGFGSVIIANLFLFAFDKVSLFFLISAAMQLVLTAIAIGIYIYQLVLIHQVDINKPVVTTQHTLAGLKSSTLWVARILFLQLPLWTTFYLSESMFKNGNILFYFIQGGVTLSFIFLAFWLYFNIKMENKHKKWFRLLFEGKEWNPVMKAMDLLSQAEEYKTAL